MISKKKISIIFSLSWISCALSFIQDDIVHVEKAVKYYNNLEGSSWEAHHNNLHNVSLSHIKSKLGLLPHFDDEEKDDFESLNEELPENFDWREVHPECTTISSIKDQANCESCWAITIAAVFSDRLCIKSDGRINVNISATNLLACNKVNDGCGGGVMGKAWNYVKHHGLVTGGDYGSFEGCQPYPISPVGTIEERNRAPRAHTPKCEETRCTNKSYKIKENRVYKTTTTIQLPPNEDDIRQEIIANGPVTAGMIVYLPFLFYKKGVFHVEKEDAGDIVGLHAVRLIGWGVENGIPYWLGINSWGRSWGDNGTFKIKRGSNHCEIESMVYAGMPKLE